MTSVLTVANEILDKADASGMPLSPLKLMKLAYIGQGWALGITGRPLFEDRIEAWKYGPVIPELYRATKKYGSGTVTERLLAPRADRIDAELDGLLASVLEKYGQLSGVALSNLTHRPGSPWSQVWNENIMHNEIPRPLIRAHYEKLRTQDVVDAA
jgi:uncharacterized phage-associated protein